MTAPTGRPETGATRAVPPPAAAPPAATPPAAVEGDDVDRLRTELAELRGRLDTRRRRAHALLALRRVTAAVFAALTAFALVSSVVGVWAARTAFDTDRWVAAMAPLPRDPAVAAAVAEYATTEVFAVLHVEDRLRSVLPEQAAFVAGPLTGQIREAVRKTVHSVVQDERFHRIWVEANRRAHQHALAILEGTSTVVVAREDRVDIDLLPLINQVLRQLSAQLPTLFGKQLTLPDLSSGEIPENLRLRVQDALGVPLPANFAQFTVYDAGQLRAVQRAMEVARRDLVLFGVGTVVLLVLALVVSPRRRRTVLQLGIWLVIAAVAVTAVLRRVREQLLLEVPAGTYRDGVGAVLTIVFASLRERGTQLIWLGAVLALLAFLVGPGRWPVRLRRGTARAARAVGRWIGAGYRAAAARGPGWTGRHRDAVRVAGVVVAVVLALLLSSWTSLFVIVLALAAFELLVTVVGRADDGTAAPPG